MDKDKRDGFEKAQEELEKLDITNIMDKENGRRFIWRLLEYSGIYHDVDVSLELSMAKQLGRRQAGLHLLTLISEVSEDEVFKMMKEAKNRATLKERYYGNQNTQETTSRRSNSTDRGSDTTDRGSYASGGLSTYI
jgi:hypothetical protein